GHGRARRRRAMLERAVPCWVVQAHHTHQFRLEALVGAGFRCSPSSGSCRWVGASPARTSSTSRGLGLGAAGDCPRPQGHQNDAHVADDRGQAFRREGPDRELLLPCHGNEEPSIILLGQFTGPANLLSARRGGWADRPFRWIKTSINPKPFGGEAVGQPLLSLFLSCPEDPHRESCRSSPPRRA